MGQSESIMDVESSGKLYVSSHFFAIWAGFHMVAKHETSMDRQKEGMS